MNRVFLKHRAAAAVLLAGLVLGACGRVRVGKGTENTQRQKDSYEERANPKAPSERQPETATIVEVDLEEPKHYERDPGDPPAKKKKEPAAKNEAPDKEPGAEKAEPK